MELFDRLYDFLLAGRCNYSFLVPFPRYMMLNIMVTLKAGLEVTQGR